MNAIKNNPALQRRLLRYSTMASLVAAASVGTGPQPAAAVPQVVATPNATIGPGDTFDIDFDQNGTPEFTVTIDSFSGYIDLRSHNQSVSFLGQPGGFSFLPYALNQGDSVSAAASGSWYAPTSTIATLTLDTGRTGYWLDLTGMRYVGVRYVNSLDSLVYYGWLELTVVDADPGPPQVTIHRYGHNTTAGEGIPSAVNLVDIHASHSPLRVAGAALLTAVAGACTWLWWRLSSQSDKRHIN